MNPNRRRDSSGFTLLELVVVLAILAVVTALATRALSHLEDQRRYDASQRGLEEIEAAVLGSDNDRAPDGTRISLGFVADMGRLPVTTAIDPENLSLGELWVNPGVPYDVRLASVANGVAADDEDLQVRVAAGWRGPYLRLPIGANNLLDGWGNAYVSPIGASAVYARLRDASDDPITATGQPIVIVRHLGADGELDTGIVEGENRDEAIAFTNNRIRSTLKGSVEVRKDDEAATVDPGDTVTIRVFAPNPINPTQISVYKVNLPFDSNPVLFNIVDPNLTIGPRVVRAYFTDNGAATTSFRRSAVKTVLLRPGVNTQDLTVDRAATP